MKFKKFTQAYFLIKNNPSYAHSLGDRAQGGVLAAVVAGIWLYSWYTPRIPANDQI